MTTPIAVLLRVISFSGRLGVVGDKLRTLLPPHCPAELKQALRQHKSVLLDLLRLEFLVVRSDALNTVVFWTSDDATKAALVGAGAAPGSVYTSSELEQLVHGRVTAGELSLIHATKQTFRGKLTEP